MEGGEIKDLLGGLSIGEDDPESRSRALSEISYQTFTFAENTEIWEGRIFAKHPYRVEERRYYLPATDDDEAKRQEMAHIYWMTHDHLVLPSPPPGTFLDFGTGAGYWVQDVAQTFPECKIIGIDLHYTEMPETRHNNEFEVDDCEGEPFPRSDPVSLINLRDSYFWVRDIRLLVRQAQDVLRLGGYFQNQEFRLNHWESTKPNFTAWRQEVLLCARNLGIQLHSAEEVRNALNVAGFQDYQERKATWRIKKSTHRSFFEFLELTVQASLRILVEGRPTTLPSTLKLLDEVLKELNEKDCRVIIQTHSCWARKCI
jgi:SAM-dependent methyltransferase